MYSVTFGRASSAACCWGDSDVGDDADGVADVVAVGVDGDAEQPANTAASITATSPERVRVRIIGRAFMRRTMGTTCAVNLTQQRRGIGCPNCQVG